MGILRPAALLSLAVCSLPLAAPPALPRPSPEFVIQYPGSSGQTLLSSYRGKVVCLEFLFTTCPHCQHAFQVMSKLYTEYGPRGFQPLGVAFNEMSDALVNDFVKNYQVNYPIGYASRDSVLTYLGISTVERFVVPQLVWIDRKGVIRSATPPTGDEKMLGEPYWREMLDTLLKEPGPAAKKGQAHRSAPHKQA
jgi:thiol-disulfide isomerase/thioredoxin